MTSRWQFLIWEVPCVGAGAMADRPYEYLQGRSGASQFVYLETICCSNNKDLLQSRSISVAVRPVALAMSSVDIIFLTCSVKCFALASVICTLYDACVIPPCMLPALELSHFFVRV